MTTATVGVPPQHIEAEEAVLGCLLLLGEDCLEQLTTEVGLSAQHFYRHGDVLRAMIALTDRGVAVDALTVIDELGVMGALNDRVRADIEVFAAAPPASLNAKHYAQIVMREHAWRARLNGLLGMHDAIEKRDEDAYHAALAAGDDTGRPDTTSADPSGLAAEFLGWYEDDQQASIPLPFPALNDKLNGGLRPGDTTIVAGWTSMGKSTLADQILIHAVHAGHDAWAYINEMSRVDRTSRMLAGLSGVPFHKITRRELDASEMRLVMPHLQALPFGITDVAGQSAEDIARHIRKRRSSIAVVDLVTRIPADTTKDWDRVSGALTDAARQSGTHLLMVCQLNRERSKGDELPPPVLRDLRNTGAWEQDAANVLFVHRDQDDVGGVAELTTDGHVRFAKARNGSPCRLPVSLDVNRMRFRS